MDVIRGMAEMRQARRRLRGRVALVPTMGCLHAGHASLIRRAREAADTVIVSIYVNPLQFGPNEDFDRYPRTFEADAALCEQLGADILFHPDTLYPDGEPRVSLRVDDALAGCLCGASRPGHFDGVATVIAILFQLAMPDIAFFGEKDWQQLVVLRRMARDLAMPVEIRGCPTVREADGLAMSSRNRYLASEDRERAAAIPKALARMADLARAGERDAARLIEAGRARLHDAGITPEYLEVRAADTLDPLARLDRAPARAFVAARVGGARLIDNMPLDNRPPTPSTQMPSTQTPSNGETP